MSQPPVSFGQWVKNRRRALDLTQEALAQVVGCAPETLRKIEADRRRPSQQLVELLAEALQIDRAERQVFLFLARSGGEAAQPTVVPLPTLPPTSPAPGASLPMSLTSLVGRVADVRAVRVLLERSDVRLVTLLGPGGTGKTRLALEVAVAEHFTDGVYWVPLAPVTDPQLVLASLAHALGVREVPGQPLATTLANALQAKPALLVLDNFEQVIAAAGHVATLLGSAPQLQILVTSRVALRVRGEYEYVIAPLAVPDHAQLPAPADLLTVGAVALFVERVQAIKPQWTLTATNAHAVAEICIRLDGLPLALELAAARTKVLSVESLLERLGQRLAVLKGGPLDLPMRQQSLRNTLEWSYELLSPDEQRLFVRLSVFAGGWTLQAAEAVCEGRGMGDGGWGMGAEFDSLSPIPYPLSPTLDVLDGIQNLIDNSLVRQLDGDDEPRFGMLETIREYAAELLDISGAAPAIQLAHAQYFAQLVEQAQSALKGPEQIVWLNRLEAEHDNFRAALGWSLKQGKAVIAARLAGRLNAFWQVRGYLSEGNRWLAAVLGLPEVRNSEVVPPLTLATVLSAVGMTEQRLGNLERARQFVEEALALSRQWGDRRDIAIALTDMANLAFAEEAYDRAVLLYQESLGLSEALGDIRGKARAMNNMGYIAQLQGDLPRAQELLEGALPLVRQLGDTMLIAWTIDRLGELAFMRGDVDVSRSLYEESLSLSRARGDKQRIAWTLVGLGQVVFDQGDHASAVAMLEESLALGRELGHRGMISAALYYLGKFVAHTGSYTRAWTLLQECIAVMRALGTKEYIILVLAHLGHIASAQAAPLEAARLWGAAEGLLPKLGVQLSPIEQADYTTSMSLASRRTDSAFMQAWAEGAAMTAEQAIAYATQPLLPTLVGS